MSTQTEAFASMIELARAGNAQAIAFVRLMIEKSATNASISVLIQLAETLLDAGRAESTDNPHQWN